MNVSLPFPQRIATMVLASVGLLQPQNQTRPGNLHCPSPIQVKQETHPVAIAVFFHHRDVKVALEELKNAGIPLTWVTLIARNCQRHQWLPGLTICDRFEETLCRQFFFKYFQKGNYLLTVQGTEDAIQFAAQILSRRRKHSEVWYLQ
jgi:hypothetical protein